MGACHGTSFGLTTLNGLRIACVVVQEYMPGGTLARALHGIDDGKGVVGKMDFSLQQKLKIADNVISAICCLHCGDPQVVHRDLKPENILLDESMNVAKVADFGLARLKDHQRSTMATVGVGTTPYMAPG